MIKILLISDLHAGETSFSTNHPGQKRQANSTALNTLEKYVPSFNDKKYDWVVNLGDNIRNTSDRDNNIKNFRESVNVFEQISLPKLYITGNHEYKNMTKEDVENVLIKSNSNYDKFGIKQIEKIKFIWIDSILGEKDLASISAETLDWLSKQIFPGDKVVLLSHYSVYEINEPANFYFGKDPKYMSYTNGDQIIDILERCNYAITINGHTHMANHKIKGNINSFSIMSFSENITPISETEINPGIYSVLEIEESKRILKTFSGDFCILRYEF